MFGRQRYWRGLHLLDECIFVFRHQIAEYFFHIDEEHGGVRVNLGHRRNGPWFEFILNEFRWRCHLAPRHADNPIDVSYMERLHIAIVFGHNEMIGFAVLPVKIRQTQHLPKIDHRQRRPPHRQQTLDARVGFGQAGKNRQGKHFSYLKHIDAIDLRDTHGEQQYLKPIGAGQLCTGIDLLNEG